MACFILEYGTESGNAHVSIDWSEAKPVTVHHIDCIAWHGDMMQFQASFPIIFAEMLRNRVIREK